MPELSRDVGTRVRWPRPRDWAIKELPRPTQAYVVSIDVIAFGLLCWVLGQTPVDIRQIGTALVLIAGAMLTVEALRRVGEPAGTFSDLQLAWTLPMALLLPPVYAMLAPVPLTVLSHFRIKYTVIYRRTFSSAALGMTNLAGALLFRSLAGAPLFGAVPSHEWLRHAPQYAGLALFAGLLATFTDYLIVIVAVKTSDPNASWRGLITNRETYILEFVEACCGVVVLVLTAVHAALVPIAVPPMLLLQRSILHGQLNAAARIDQKTGLLNAGTWNREAERELRTSDPRRPASVLLIDLDHFKQVNDEHGHLAGDQVLKLVAEVLASEIRKADLAGRFGGEEFVLLLADTPQAEAGRIAERLRTRIADLALETAEARPARTTASIGIAVQGRDGSDLMELLAAADTALYRAKSAGRNRTWMASEAR